MLQPAALGFGAAAAGAGSLLARSVIVFKNFTDAISRLSMISVVFVWSSVCTSSNGIATMRPNAVVFIATEMLAESKSAFSAGFADRSAHFRITTAPDVWRTLVQQQQRPRPVPVGPT